MGTLVVASHASFERSLANQRLLQAIAGVADVSIRVLDRLYPDGRIDAAAERALAEAADRIVFQFPLTWYSTPPLLKRWQDEVLSVGWAYGPGGTRLRGKTLQLVVTCGASAESYRSGGYNGYPIEGLLLPLRATAEFVGMRFAEPLILYDVPNVPGLPLPAADPAGIDGFAQRYRALLAGTSPRAG